MSDDHLVRAAASRRLRARAEAWVTKHEEVGFLAHLGSLQNRGQVPLFLERCEAIKDTHGHVEAVDALHAHYRRGAAEYEAAKAALEVGA